MAATYKADLYINLNGANTGDAITVTNLAAGTNGGSTANYTSPWVVTDVNGALKVNASQVSMPYNVLAAGVTYPAGGNSRSMSVDHTYALGAPSSAPTAYIKLPAGKRTATVNGYLRIGPDATHLTSGKLFDFVAFRGITTGLGVVLQLNSGNSGAYQVNIESHPNYPGTPDPVHSTYITVTSGTLYWYSFRSNFTSGVCELSLYDGPAGNLVASVSSTQQVGENIEGIRFGNGENGTSPGYYSFFEDTFIDYSNAVYPAAFPSAPTIGNATAISTSSIRVGWTDTSGGLASFLIQRSAHDAATFSTVGTAAANANTYTDTGLSSNITYDYQVLAQTSGGISVASNVANATTLSPAPLATGGGRPGTRFMSFTR